MTDERIKDLRKVAHRWIDTEDRPSSIRGALLIECLDAVVALKADVAAANKALMHAKKDKEA